MDIQSFINGVNLAIMSQSAKEYSLGKLIKDCEKLNPALIVEIDTGDYPALKTVNAEELLEGDEKSILTVFNFWRGPYRELSITYSKKNQNITVIQLLEMAKFIENKHIPIYIDNGEEWDSPKLMGIKEENEKAILITRVEE